MSYKLQLSFPSFNLKPLPIDCKFLILLLLGEAKIIFSIDGILMPVIDIKINFKKPALFDDKLKLITKLVRTPSYMIEFEFEVVKKEKIISSGYTKLVFLNSVTNKPMRCPNSIIDALNKV